MKLLHVWFQHQFSYQNATGEVIVDNRTMVKNPIMTKYAQRSLWMMQYQYLGKLFGLYFYRQQYKKVLVLHLCLGCNPYSLWSCL